MKNQEMSRGLCKQYKKNGELKSKEELSKEKNLIVNLIVGICGLPITLYAGYVIYIAITIGK